MPEIKNEFCTLADLSKKFDLNKSTLLYYSSLGLINPEGKLGKTGFYIKSKAEETVSKIISLRKKGKTLQEIFDIVNE